jgi:mycothiol synthase
LSGYLSVADSLPSHWRPVRIDEPADRALIMSIVHAHEGSVPGAEPQTEDAMAMELSGTAEEPAELFVTVFVHLQFLYPSQALWADIYGEPHVSAAALAATMTEALDVGRSVVGPTNWDVKTGCYGGDARAAEFYRASGFEFQRRFLRMLLDFRDTRPEAGPLSADVVLRAVEPADVEGQRDVHFLFEDSFRDHWDHHERTFENWLEHMQTMRDPAGERRSWVLYRDGEPAAMCVADESRRELGYGFVGLLGVRREFRGRGLAKWLLLNAFADAYDRGRQGVMLTVDSESETGADALYRSVGMQPGTDLLAWRRPLFD